MNIKGRITDPMPEIDDLTTLHTNGFELQDVRFSFTRDIKVKVAGVEIDAKDGELMNIPRYIANILENDKYGEIQDTDMVIELKQANVKEIAQGDFELAVLDEHFYIKLKSYMRKLSESDYDKVESMLNTLLRRRHGKIIHLADSLKLTAELSGKMTVEEREFYNNLHNISAKFTRQIMGDKK